MPVPIASRLVLMPVRPSVTVSKALNFAGSVCSAMALKMDFDESQAPAAAVAERIRNSLTTHASSSELGLIRGYTEFARIGKVEPNRGTSELANRQQTWGA